MYINWSTTLLINIINLLILFSILVIAKWKSFLQRILKSAQLYAIIWMFHRKSIVNIIIILITSIVQKMIEMDRNLTIKISNAIY